MLELLNQLDGFGSDENIKVRTMLSARAPHALLSTCISCVLLCRSLLPRTERTFWTQP